MALVTKAETAQAKATMSDRAQPGGNKGIRLSHDPRVDVLKDAFSGAMEAGGVEGKMGALAVEKAAKALGLDLEEIVSSHRQEIHHRRLEESRRYEAATGPALGAPARALPRISQGGACLGSRRGCARPRRSPGPMDVLWRSCPRWSRPAKG